MKHSLSAAVTCAGAVIGAGFASGREIVTFFTRYGEQAWWLILLAVAVMAALACLCAASARRCGAQGCWCALFVHDGTGAQLCTGMLLTLTAGAMIAAAGSIAELMWAHEWAYPIGAAGTLLAAWLMGGRNLRWLGCFSAVLTVLLFGMVVLAMGYAPETQSALLTAPAVDGWAVLRAVGYAAMNMTLAIGVVCQCTQGVSVRRFGWGFGGLMAVLLYTCNALYLRHPQVYASPFPLVALLRCFGREGFAAGVWLMDLSVFTTLTAVLCALRSTVRQHVRCGALELPLSMGLPLLVSLAGFETVVDGLYAPAGLICLLLVFAPLLFRK